jgi:hypothetical protein
VGDKVVLMPYSGGQPLHVSELELPDHPGSKEVCLKEKKTNFLRTRKRKRERGIKSCFLLVLQYY